VALCSLNLKSNRISSGAQGIAVTSHQMPMNEGFLRARVLCRANLVTMEEAAINSNFPMNTLNIAPLPPFYQP
jgi:hypothetical protein